MSATAQPVQVVAGVLLDAAGRVLLGQRPRGKQLAGQWEFPGGKLELGESHADALRRELREELGIAVTVMDTAALVSVPQSSARQTLVIHAYRVSAWRGRVRALEHAALAWCDPATVNHRLAPADQVILAALQEHARPRPALHSVGKAPHRLD